MTRDDGGEASREHFERLDVTCSICGKTNRMAVWKRIASELGAPFSIVRIAKETRCTCPHCSKTGRPPE